MGLRVDSGGRLVNAEELEVGRRNLLAQLKRELSTEAEVYPLDAATVRDLVEVLEGVAVTRWPGYGECAAEHPRGLGQCVFVAGHHHREIESWTPHADRFGRSWNDNAPEEEL